MTLEKVEEIRYSDFFSKMEMFQSHYSKETMMVTVQNFNTIKIFTVRDPKERLLKTTIKDSNIKYQLQVQDMVVCCSFDYNEIIFSCNKNYVSLIS